RFGGVVGLVRRDLQAAVAGFDRHHAVRYLTRFGKQQSQAAAVLLLAADGRVMYLKDDLRTGGDELGHPGRKGTHAQPWHVRRKVSAGSGPVVWDAVGRFDEDQDVVHDRAIAG